MWPPAVRQTGQPSWLGRPNLWIHDSFTTSSVSRLCWSNNFKVFVNALVQYNTDTRQWSSNARLDIIHRPLSDIYLVYNERHVRGRVR
jgi:hypothetical protein